MSTVARCTARPQCTARRGGGEAAHSAVSRIRRSDGLPPGLG